MICSNHAVASTSMLFKTIYLSFLIVLREKCPNTKFFLVHIFPCLDWIRRYTLHLSVFNPNARKYESEKNSEFFFFFSIWVFFHEHSRITGLPGKEGISLSPHYHFHPLHKHLDISRAITAETSPLHIASNRTRTWTLWIPNVSH